MSSSNPKQRPVDPARYQIAPTTVDGGEVDLDREVVIGPDGVRVTEAAAAAYTERRGRRSLSGGRGKSPQVAFRLDPELQSKAETAAAAKGTTVSSLARTALSEWLTVHSTDPS